jgi:DNA-binding response OmpR family regulator
MMHAARPDHRVLVVEDELMIAMLFDSILDASSQCTVIGPFARVKLALEAARNEPLHAALLDIHLAGEPVFPVADVLAERGVPFAFVTGYGKDELPPVYRDRPLLQKPFRPRAVLAMIEMMIALPNHRE